VFAHICTIKYFSEWHRHQ